MEFDNEYGFTRGAILDFRKRFVLRTLRQTNVAMKKNVEYHTCLATDKKKVGTIEYLSPAATTREKGGDREVFTTPILCLSLLLRLFHSHEGIFAQFGEPGNKVGKFKLAKLDVANFFDQFLHSSVLSFNEGVGTRKQTN